MPGSGVWSGFFQPGQPVFINLYLLLKFAPDCQKSGHLIIEDSKTRVFEKSYFIHIYGETNVFIKCFADQNNFKEINVTYISGKIIIAADL